MLIELLFALVLLSVTYAFVGYPLLLALVVRLRKEQRLHSVVRLNRSIGGGELPARVLRTWPRVTLLVAAYNEEDHVVRKVRNSRALRYPADKLEQVWVTDGCDDNPVALLSLCQDVEVFHSAERLGKGAALNRVVPMLDTDIVVFSDANAMYHPDAIRELVRPFEDPAVGGVSGEKRVVLAGFTSGEGLYWRYESWLKSKESALHSVMGSAGEIFAIRHDLFQPVPADAVIEDFELTMGLVERGWRNVYQAGAVATELPCANAAGDFERRARIAAGGCKAVIRLRSLANPAKHGWVAFSFLSHRVLRWWVAPALVMALLPLNVLVVALSGSALWSGTLAVQLVLVGLALAQHLLPREHAFMRIPHFFYLANASALVGLVRFLRGSQAVTWKRVARATDSQRR